VADLWDLMRWESIGNGRNRPEWEMLRSLRFVKMLSDSTISFERSSNTSRLEDGEGKGQNFDD